MRFNRNHGNSASTPFLMMFSAKWQNLSKKKVALRSVLNLHPNIILSQTIAKFVKVHSGKFIWEQEKLWSTISEKYDKYATNWSLTYLVCLPAQNILLQLIFPFHAGNFNLPLTVLHRNERHSHNLPKNNFSRNQVILTYIIIMFIVIFIHFIYLYIVIFLLFPYIYW